MRVNVKMRIEHENEISLRKAVADLLSSDFIWNSLFYMIFLVHPPL
jgi:hypothetical protein